MRTRSTRVGGYALVETMVTIVVIAFGLLGVAGLVSRSFVTEAEATQRTQAALLLQDMASRIEANRANAVQYVTGDNGISGYEIVNNAKSVISCDQAAPLVDRDRCDWGRLIAGVEERIEGQTASVLVGGIGCVYELDAFNRVYAISVAWQGPSDAANAIVNDNFPPTKCGRDLYGDESRRRIVTTLLRIGTLNPPPAAAGAP